jgi:hypothetical protein
MTTALALASTPLDPQNMEQAVVLSERLSKSGLVPQAFRGKPDDILLVMLGGRELGFSTVQSLRSFYVISGRLGMYSAAMVALCVKSPLCHYFRLVESTATQATYITHRKGSDPVQYTYTMAMANKSGASKNATYSAHPDAMLRARCESALARIVFPDLLAGVYAPEEFDEEPDMAKATVLKEEPHVEPDPDTRDWEEMDGIVMSLREEIASAPDAKKLWEIASTMGRLPKDDPRTVLRPAWSKRMKEVNGAANSKPAPKA